MSRARNILISSKGIPTKDPIADLIGLKLGGASVPVVDITGNLPLSFNAKRTSALESYRLYGTSEGAGVQTENLYNYLDDTANCYLKSDGTLKTDETGYYTSDFIAVEPSTTYTITRTGSVRVKGYDSTKQPIRTDTYNDYNFYASTGNTFTVDSNTHYIRFTLTSAFYDRCTLVPGSTAPASYIPPGYQIPLTNTSGETENEFDKDNLNIVKAYINSNNAIVSYNTNGLIYVPVVTGETYTISGFKRNLSTIDIKWGITASMPENGVSCSRTGLLNQSSSLTVNIASGEKYLCIFLCGDSDYTQYGSVEQAIMKNVETGMIVLGSTAPDHYIPHRYTADYNLYIGDTKLGAEEYVDYQEQKIYKLSADLWDVNGTTTNQRGETRPGNEFATGASYVVYNNSSTTLYYRVGVSTDVSSAIQSNTKLEITPNDTLVIWLPSSSYMSDVVVKTASYADPPAPFPSVTAYKGENTLSSTETVGEVTVTGRISEIPEP